MPYFGFSAPASSSFTNGFGAPSQAMTNQAVQAAYPVELGNPLVNTLGVAGLALPDMADTLYSSTLGHFTGNQRGDINNAMLGAVNLPGLSDFYEQHKSGIETASGIGGIIAADLVARRITAPAGAFMGFLKAVPYLGRIATLDAEYTEATSVVRAADMEIASRGEVGQAYFQGEVTVPTMRFDAAARDFVPSSTTITRDRAVFNAKALGALKGVRDAAVTEGVAYAAMNQNGFLYSDDAAQNMAWQAIGLGIGAGSEWLHAAYQVRRTVNGQNVKRAFAGALDPEGVEASRLNWLTRPSNSVPDESLGFLGGSYSDHITDLMVSNSQLKNLPVAGSDPAALLKNRTALATQHEQLAIETAQKISTKGISTNGFTRFSMNAPGYGNHIAQLIHNDAAGLYGVEMMGGIAEETGPSIYVHQEHMNRLNELIDETETKLAGGSLSSRDMAKVQDFRKRLDFQLHLTPEVLIDHERMPLDEAAAFEGFAEPKLQFVRDPAMLTTTGDAHGTVFAQIKDSATAPVSVGTDFLYHVPDVGKTPLNQIDHYDMLRLYRAGNDALKRMETFKGPITLPANPDWFQLDMAEQLLKNTNGNARIVWPTGMTRDSAQLESWAQKAKGFEFWQNKQARDTLGRASAGLDASSMLSRLRVRFNLPRLTAYERGLTGLTEHPVESLLRGTMGMDPAQIKAMSVQELQEAVATRKRIGDLSPVTGKDMRLQGNSFNYMLDDQGAPVKPILMYTRPFRDISWSADDLADRLASRKLLAMGEMTNPQAGPMTNQLTTSLMQSTDAQTAAATHELMDAQIQGSIFGAAPQTFAATNLNAVKTSDWLARDNPILLAASRVRDLVERISRGWMESTFKGAFGDSLNLLANPRNAASKLLLDTFHSFSDGWDLEKKAITQPDGFFGFKLSDTQKNRERWRQLHGTDMPKGQTLVSHAGQPVVLDALSLDLQNRFNTVSDALLKEKNTLLRAHGMNQIERQNWYVPSTNLNGKYVGFTFDALNKIVPGFSVVADTPEQFAIRAKQVADHIAGKPGFTFRTQEEVKNFMSIWDRAQMDMINPGTTAIQPGKTATGALRGPVVDTSAWNNSLQEVRNQFLAHSNDVTESFFKEQINASKARSQMSGNLVANNPKLGEVKFRNVYDIYLQNLLGKSKLNSGSSAIAGLYNWTEGFLDQALKTVSPAASMATQTMSNTWKVTNTWINRANPWRSTPGAIKDFEALSSALGPYMPFKSAADLLEAKGYGAKPWTSAAMSSKLNQFAAATVLRMFEVAHPIMNLAGMVNAMPSVIRHYTMTEAEMADATGELYANRVGHSALIFQTKQGPLGVVDWSKLAANSFKRAWQASSEPDYKFMVNRGYITQEVSEFHRQFGAIDSQGKWDKFFNGDRSITNPQGVAQNLSSKGLIGWLSVLSDKSEDLSRAWGHMAGLELADRLGIAGMESRHGFAHDLANKMIANYSPHNRPEIYQGAIGTTLGLFQSFMQEYYQRMFRYIETKDHAALVNQYVMQGSLFGVNTIPGFAEYNQFSAQLDNGNDPQSVLRHQLGQSVGALIGNGVISNIPAIFGGEGVDLYSRGDTSIRLPGLNVPPAISIAGKVMQGISGAISDFAEGAGGGLTRTQLAEVVSNMIPNRPIAGMFQRLMTHGDEIDPVGQIKSQTQTALEATYRILGLRSQRQADELNAYYANKQMMSHKAAADQVLNMATRAAMREGNYSVMPALFQKYLENGGDPRHMRQWMKNNFTAATTSRGQRQLDAALKNPQNMAQVLRLVDAGVPIDRDAKTPDPTAYYGTGDQGDPLNQSTASRGDYSSSGQFTQPPGQTPQ